MNENVIRNLPEPAVKSLDAKFRPAGLANRKFLEEVRKSGGGVKLAIALERNDGFVAAYKTQVFAEGTGGTKKFYVRRAAG